MKKMIGQKMLSNDQKKTKGILQIKEEAYNPLYASD